ncbi:nickel pincer cofactor biosynthesis protein LarB [Planctomicrobium piriforme]|uniref:PurE domain-containing protein n=1 Tax=Planctomicrobium piriforme TaxID=1576369 RepID=A0A1I3RRP2_9PLAN|nr:nickel pincer cofactor biosynthesis protein LarB [Planctomicrobium piriforme]SFJ47951.1 hypothetical protein SAMN05421753_12171 [Planctomicrobium piriforme]
MSAESASPDLLLLLQRLVTGEQSLDEVYQAISRSRCDDRLGSVAVNPQGDVRLDLDRERRCGYPEVIYAPGKSVEALVQTFQRLLTERQNGLATRCSSEQISALQAQVPEAIVNTVARTVRWNRAEPESGKVAVVAAGTSDRPIAEEAVETLRWMNVSVDLVMDVGVAGPQRFLQEKHRLEGAGAVVVVAGMEGALPSVVAGWVACPVIAVPTSVGYGASFGGLTALLGMLNSCAANVAVVNIDAGFKGGYLAGMIARQTIQ